MRQRWSYLVVIVILSLLVAAPTLRASQGDGRATLDLVRVSDVIEGTQAYGPFVNGGTDPLTNGRTDVDHKRQVHLNVKGAVASDAYDIYFCRLGSDPSAGCVKLGSLSTDNKGNGTASVALDSSLMALAGSFVLTRDNANQFVSGIAFPSAKEVPPDGADIGLTGKVNSVNGTAKSFQLEGLSMDILTGDTTLYSGLAGFDALAVGQVVKVKGALRPADKNIFALRVQSEDDPSESSDIPAGGFKIDVTGKISSISKPSFQLEGLPIDIVTGDTTAYPGHSGFDALAVGQVVEVKGISQTVGSTTTILAQQVRSDDGSGKGNGRQIGARAKHGDAKSQQGGRGKEHADLEDREGD